jgi:hypothetical protein
VNLLSMIKDTDGLKALADTGRLATRPHSLGLGRLGLDLGHRLDGRGGGGPGRSRGRGRTGGALFGFGQPALEGFDALLVGITQLAELLAKLLQIGIGCRGGDGREGRSKGNAKRAGTKKRHGSDLLGSVRKWGLPARAGPAPVITKGTGSGRNGRAPGMGPGQAQGTGNKIGIGRKGSAGHIDGQHRHVDGSTAARSAAARHSRHASWRSAAGTPPSGEIWRTVFSARASAARSPM